MSARVRWLLFRTRLRLMGKKFWGALWSWWWFTLAIVVCVVAEYTVIGLTFAMASCFEVYTMQQCWSRPRLIVKGEKVYIVEEKP
jgi:hypothetical protein